MPTKNLSLIFKRVPEGMPVPGKDLAVEDRPIDLEQELPPHHLLVETLYSSVDPYMRSKLREPGVKSYSPPFDLDKPLAGHAIARVLKSSHTQYQPDEVLIGYVAIAQYAVVDLGEDGSKNPSVRKIINPYHLEDLRLFLGPLGMPGLTAYASLYEIGKPQKGETIFISSAAGAVGQLVGQLAVQEGLTVIGSVGSQEKLDFITKELGFHSGYNYKDERPGDALTRLAPNGIDIYYENVGGEHLEAALNHLNLHGRVVVSGMISDYNKPLAEKYPIRNLFKLTSQRIMMRGFIVGDKDIGPKHAKDHQTRVGALLKEGKIKAKLDELGTIETADQAFVDMLAGKNFGKALVRVKAGCEVRL